MKAKLLRKLRAIGRQQIDILGISVENNIITGMAIGSNCESYADIFEYGDTEEAVYKKSENIYLSENIQNIRSRYVKYTRKHNVRRRDPMLNYFWDWSDFSIGFSIAKPHRLTGWNYYVSVDIAWFSCWLYF
jgi:hypothetical protein